MDKIPFDHRVKVTSITFEGETMAWHMSSIISRNSVLDPSWTEFVLPLNERFGVSFENPIKALKNLQQIGSVREY